MEPNMVRKANMKTMIKSMIAGAVALGVVALGTSQAEAWPIAPVVVGSVAAGAVVGATIATAVAPHYYGYPAPVYYSPPVYSAPVCPAPVVAVAPYCYPQPVVVVGPRPYWYGGARGYWGPHYGYGYRGRGFRR
jgi:hypothetical protein